ncbi:4653_t:CDS:2 [Diversispora eburnea]|uniref:4653_t:CDS:1 n=1 Tax=Diversispora eburnea TaxID=1213867 RepID=A0A9N9CN59_9GLOM|nr:4653_t:CDS:2 [Diversispora eburnea]
MLDEDSMQDIDISINDLFPVSVQTIVYIFRKVIRSGQDTILYWYHFVGKYDRRIDEVSVSNKVGKKKATSLIYHEIKQFLPDITDVNLRHIILKARKIRTLFSAVGIEKIKQVSYSANAISNLSYTQIQNIINYVLSAPLARPKTVTICHNQINVEVSVSATSPIPPTNSSGPGKLIGILTDKIRSKLYKRYKNETGLDPWMDSKPSESFEEKTLFVPQVNVQSIPSK